MTKRLETTLGVTLTIFFTLASIALARYVLETVL